MPVPTRRRLAYQLGMLVPVVLCALAAHAVVYRSFFPHGAAHGYLGWYEPLIGALSLASLSVFALALVMAAGARESSALTEWLAVFSSWLRSQGSTRLWTRLSGGGLAFLVLQESFERSMQAGRPEIVVFSAGSWLLLLLALGAFAGCIALIARSGIALVEHVLRTGSRPGARHPSAASGLPRSAFAAPRRRNPLAERRGLRAPPLLAS